MRLYIFFATFLLSSCCFAKENLCQKIINDFVKEAGLGQSMDKLNSFFNRKITPANPVTNEFTKVENEADQSYEKAKKNLLHTSKNKKAL